MTVTSLVTTNGDNCVGGICMVRTIILAKFFNDDSSDIEVIGSVGLKLVGDSNGHRLDSSVGKAASTGFDIVVDLVELEDVAGAVVNVLGFFTYLVSAAIIAFSV